ncbi:MAG: acyl-CoA dehydrogenase [Burkholderiales bacterium]|nr:acyl-CoA dehydrogenase [Burkholderiales bacterium]
MHLDTCLAIEHALRAAPTATETPDVAAWWPQWQALAATGAPTAALAIRGGFAADRLGWAFASGYQAALRALLPDLPADTLAAFCVTEAGGNRPRDIRTTLTPEQSDTGAATWRLDGAKRWTTLGPAGTLLLVVGAVVDADAARPLLRVARVPVPSAGLTVEPMPATGFVPEVPHARLRLQGVRVPDAALLPGDGYDTCVKPFRTIEDLHVTLAALACLLREARARAWPVALAERAAALITLLAGLAEGDTRAPAAHVALAGALQLVQALYAQASELFAATPDEPAAQRWRRDVPLFGVAGAARTQRAARAWAALGG